jgi:hypothetical protein
VSPLRWLEPANRALETPVWIREDEFDWCHALGESSGGGAAVADKSGKFAAQRGMQVLHESQSDAAALARRQAESRICSDDEFDAAAEHLIIAAGMGPAAAPPGQRVAGLDIGLGSGSDDGYPACRWSGAVAVGVCASVVLVPGHMRSKPQPSEMLNSPRLTGIDRDLSRIERILVKVAGGDP